jgi:creatinine amidohydrolase/Fe(II)-dependent formamide hydrolase-like protein
MEDSASRPWHAITILLVSGLVVIACQPRPATTQVYRLAELNTEQIRALDRAKTVILLPGGILEEHGPYLPSYTDGYLNERLTSDLATAIAGRPGWSVVVFPVIPLGAGGANEVGARFPFPGTYAIRPDTLRAVFMDLAEEFGEQGFRWLFLVHAHGSPAHNRALDAAGEYFRDVYGGRMIHLAGLDTGHDPAVEVMRAGVTPEALDENGLDVHAGLLEANRMLALRPDLVPSTLAEAPSLAVRDLADVSRVASSPDWPGYFGAPRYATPALGRRIVKADSGWLIDITLQLLDGKIDERQIARVSALENVPDVAKALEPGRQRNAAMARRQQEWVMRRNSR